MNPQAVEAAMYDGSAQVTLDFTLEDTRVALKAVAHCESFAAFEELWGDDLEDTIMLAVDAAAWDCQPFPH